MWDVKMVLRAWERHCYYVSKFRVLYKRRTDLWISVLLSHVIFFKVILQLCIDFPLASTWESKSHELKFVLIFSCPFPLWHLFRAYECYETHSKDLQSLTGAGNHTPFFFGLKYFGYISFFFFFLAYIIPLFHVIMVFSMKRWTDLVINMPGTHRCP